MIIDQDVGGGERRGGRIAVQAGRIDRPVKGDREADRAARRSSTSEMGPISLLTIRGPAAMTIG